MAIRLQGQLSTVSGETTGSYLRIEYVKFMPWVGEVEYNQCYLEMKWNQDGLEDSFTKTLYRLHLYLYR